MFPNVLKPTGYRCSDGYRCLSVSGACASIGLRALKKVESVADAAIVDHERRRLIVGDVRLYDRSATIARVGARDDESDLALVAKVFDDFGPSGLAGIVGDFAIVIWDWGTQTISAARDHFGIKPLHYKRLPNGIAFATDVRQLLALDNDREVDPETALDFLLSDYRHFGRTFFRSVGQVRPAHAIVVSELSSVERHYWSPPSVVEYSDYEEVVEHWRHLFSQAVRCRLGSDYPIVSHLSGGLDSGSIVGAAHAVYASSENRPEFVTLSARFPGLDCDESEYIDAVLRRTPLFRGESWNGLHPNTADFYNPTIVIPGLRRGPGGGPRRDMEIARGLGARTFLTGTGGDELGWARGVSRDLFGSLGLFDMAQEVLAVGRQRAFAYLREGMRGLIPLRNREGAPRRAGLPAPAWLGSRLRVAFSGEEATSTRQDFAFTSHYQREVWNALNSPLAAACIDMLTLVGAESGLETQMPYLDLRLVEFVLSLSWKVRLPRGDMRRLQRDGVASFLPNRVRRRMTKPNFASAVSAHARTALPAIERIFYRHAADWRSADFVDQAAARSALAHLLQSDPHFGDWRAWRALWLLAAFEIWMSHVSSYTPAERSTHGHGQE